MLDRADKKAIMLCILKVLEIYTDAEHTLTYEQIAQRLEKDLVSNRLAAILLLLISLFYGMAWIMILKVDREIRAFIYWIEYCPPCI